MYRRVSPALSHRPKIGKVIGATPKAARPKRATAIPIPRISGEEYRRRVRIQKDGERGEARNLRNILFRQQPSDRWNPDSAVSAGAGCISRQGMIFLAMSDATNNTAAEQALSKEMMTHRRIWNDNAYMRHLQEYIDPGKNTRNTKEEGPNDI